MELIKKSETSTKITFVYDKPQGNVEGYLYYADDVRVARTFNPDDLEVTFGKVSSGRYAVEAVGFDLLGRADWPKIAPTPVGVLMKRPPGWNGDDPTLHTSYPGFTHVGRFEECIDSAKNYFVEQHAVVNHCDGPGRTTVASIPSGNHVVCVGADLDGKSVSVSDDGLVIIAEQGSGVGTVYLEGIDFNEGPNLITGRTTRNIIVQNCKGNARAANDVHTQGIHPDIYQEWRRSVDARRGYRFFHRCDFGSTMTFVNDFTDETTTDGRQAPSYFELQESSFRSLRPLDGDPPLIGLGFWMGCPGKVSYKGKAWLETSYESASSRRGLGDMLRYYGEQYSPRYAGYQILDANNVVIYTREPASTATSDPTNARTNGKILRYHRDPLMTIEWRYGRPTPSDGADTNGNFVIGTPGVGYKSPGYV